MVPLLYKMQFLHNKFALLMFLSNYLTLYGGLLAIFACCEYNKTNLRKNKRRTFYYDIT